jgi:leucyl aminopeptidase
MAGASTAAAFLAHFIGDTKWLHLDIAGSAYKDGVPTGVMLDSLTKFLMEEY